jgi:hypothetical protein
VINRHPAVRTSRAKSHRNPITGSIVVVDIVPAEDGIDHEKEIRNEILYDCPAHRFLQDTRNNQFCGNARHNPS